MNRLLLVLFLFLGGCSSCEVKPVTTGENTYIKAVNASGIFKKDTWTKEEKNIIQGTLEGAEQDLGTYKAKIEQLEKEKVKLQKAKEGLQEKLLKKEKQISFLYIIICIESILLIIGIAWAVVKLYVKIKV